jgi:hypothetical protein
VVLRHKPSVHENVQAVLVDSGVATPANSGQTAGREGGGFGGGGGGGGFFRVDPVASE